MAELDLSATERGRTSGRAAPVRHGGTSGIRSEESVMAGIDYLERIPNNVDLSENRRLQRALEEWQPRFLEWWNDMGPEGCQAKDAYIRTSASDDAQDWAKSDYVRTP